MGNAMKRAKKLVENGETDLNTYFDDIDAHIDKYTEIIKDLNIQRKKTLEDVAVIKPGTKSFSLQYFRLLYSH